MQTLRRVEEAVDLDHVGILQQPRRARRHWPRGHAGGQEHPLYRGDVDAHKGRQQDVAECQLPVFVQGVRLHTLQTLQVNARGQAQLIKHRERIIVDVSAHRPPIASTEQTTSRPVTVVVLQGQVLRQKCLDVACRRTSRAAFNVQHWPPPPQRLRRAPKHLPPVLQRTRRHTNEVDLAVANAGVNHVPLRHLPVNG